MATEAGKGASHVYRMNPSQTDNKPLKAGQHYVGIEALSWFVNKESSWLKKRMGTATIQLKVNGDEDYNSALGTFKLDDGAKIAPVFNKRILKERNYRGDSIEFKVTLSMLKRDTAIGGLLRSAASTSLDIVSGMVETATIAGPAKVLSAAGGSLVNGVNDLLKEDDVKADSFFEPYIENTIPADRIVGPETYLLFHRGADLDESLIKIDSNDEMVFPKYNGAELKDGAWVLIRIKRSDEYPDIRPWFERRRNLKGKVSDLVNNVEDGIINKSDALKQFVPSDTGDQTIVDEYFKLRSLIRNDGVITPKQEALFVSDLRSFVFSAKKAISNDNLRLFDGNKKPIVKMIKEGKSDKEHEVMLFEEIDETLSSRSKILEEFDVKTFETPKINLEDFHGMFASMPKSMAELDWLPKNVKSA